MAVTINGDGTIIGVSVGGLPDGVVDSGTLATNSVDSAELIDGAIDSSHLASGWLVTGKVLQMLGTTSTFTGTTMSTTNNTWVDTGVTITFTPISATSKFLVYYGIMVQMADTSGDGGYSMRVKRVQGASTVYPDELSDHRTANMHSSHYHSANSALAAWVSYHTYSGVDHDSHTTSPVTYTIQGGQYNVASLVMGNAYNARPQMIVQEVEV